MAPRPRRSYNFRSSLSSFPSRRTSRWRARSCSMSKRGLGSPKASLRPRNDWPAKWMSSSFCKYRERQPGAHRAGAEGLHFGIVYPGHSRLTAGAAKDCSKSEMRQIDRPRAAWGPVVGRGDYTSTLCPGPGWMTLIFGWRARIWSSNHWRDCGSPCPSTTARGDTWPTKSSNSSRLA